MRVRWVLDLEQIDPTDAERVGGKAAGLAAVARIAGIRVPVGFCVTTEAFRAAVGSAPAVGAALDRLVRLAPDEVAARTAAAELRRAVEAVPIPTDLSAEIGAALARRGDRGTWAVRSSATAEDGADASFAGQHDSFLDVDADEVVATVRRCWASLYTDRALAYRARRGLDPRAVRMAVVVQRMLAPRASGVLFTADPVTGHRKVSVVEAVAGLGESLVAGRAEPESARVRGDRVLRDRAGRLLTDAEVLELARLGRTLEIQLGAPQDVEWCLVGDGAQVVQCRPITTLFPVPPTEDDRLHVYLSVGHGQMMTDAMRPLGLSLFRAAALRPMTEAGGRLWVDVTAALASPGRAALLEMCGRSDPLIRDALQTLIDRGDLGPPAPPPGRSPPAPPPLEADRGADPELVPGLLAAERASFEALERRLAGLSGPELVDAVLEDLGELKRLLTDPLAHRVVMGGFEDGWWLDDRLREWLGETHAADVLTRSAPGNVTSEMGLALLDVADVIRRSPRVVEALRADVSAVGAVPEGGEEAARALAAFLEAYGMRCVGEIDVTRPRWVEDPSALVSLLLANVAAFAPGESRRRFERGRAEAEDAARRLVERVRALPDGEARAEEVARRIERLRAFAGYREYPKYTMMKRWLAYKRALLREARRWVEAGVTAAEDDVHWLTLEEVGQVARSLRLDPALVATRRRDFQRHLALRPPRVLTSDGEGVAGSYHREPRPGSLIGLPVSPGRAEGRARVVAGLHDADLEPGDILVTTGTDPSWTPAFVTLAALVTEVGGRTTHGSVIAREYGLPAVVGVLDATRRIRDGQRIRVDGSAGSVELLD